MYAQHGSCVKDHCQTQSLLIILAYSIIHQTIYPHAEQQNNNFKEKERKLFKTLYMYVYWKIFYIYFLFLFIFRYVAECPEQIVLAIKIFCHYLITYHHVNVFRFIKFSKIKVFILFKVFINFFSFFLTFNAINY